MLLQHASLYLSLILVSLVAAAPVKSVFNNGTATETYVRQTRTLSHTYEPETSGGHYLENILSGIDSLLDPTVKSKTSSLMLVSTQTHSSSQYSRSKSSHSDTSSSATNSQKQTYTREATSTATNSETSSTETNSATFASSDTTTPTTVSSTDPSSQIPTVESSTQPSISMSEAPYSSVSDYASYSSETATGIPIEITSSDTTSLATESYVQTSSTALAVSTSVAPIISSQSALTSSYTIPTMEPSTASRIESIVTSHSSAVIESVTPSSIVPPVSVSSISAPVSISSVVQPIITSSVEPIVSIPSTSEVHLPSVVTTYTLPTFSTSSQEFISTVRPEVSITSEAISPEQASFDVSSHLPTQTISSEPSPISTELSSISSLPSNTNWWVPTQILTDVETSTDITGSVSSTGSIQATANAILPHVIAGPTTEYDTPADYTLITIGFYKPLNYKFVVSNSKSSAQIFSFLPLALSTPFRGQLYNVTVLQIAPLTLASKDYTVSVAEVYFPTSQIANLQAYINDLSSELYTENIGAEKSLASLIDPSIPLTGLFATTSASDGSSDSSGLHSSTSSDANTPKNPKSSDSSSSATSHQTEEDNNMGTLGGFTSKSSSSNNGSSKPDSKNKIVTIVVISVIGSVIYFISMGYIIRRYVKYNKSRPVIQSPIHDNDDDLSSIYSGSSNSNINLDEKALSKAGSDALQKKDNEDIVSTKINEWMNEAHFGKNENTLNDYQIEQVTQMVRDISRPKISRPIASENSLGWNEV